MPSSISTIEAVRNGNHQLQDGANMGYSCLRCGLIVSTGNQKVKRGASEGG
jgi:hypothetical protein